MYELHDALKETISPSGFLKTCFFLNLCEHQGEGYNERRPQMHMFRAAVYQLLELIDNYSWRRLSSEEKAPPDDFGDAVVRATLVLDMILC